MGKRKPNGYWTKEKCHDEALNFNTKKDFEKIAGSAYNKAMKNKWLGDICSHMVSSYNQDGYWTKEKCHEEALKYNTRKFFQNGNQYAYQTARKNKWLDEICSHMVLQHKPNGYWTKVRCHNEALKYDTRGDFQLSSKSSYNKSVTNGWLDEICSHMVIVGSKYKRCIYSYEFPNNHVYVGLTYNLENRHKDRLKDNNDSVTKYIKSSGLVPLRNQLTEYIDVYDAQRLEGEYVNKYKNSGWVVLNKVKTGGLGGNNLKWSFDKCKEEALKYITSNEFKKGTESAYQKARVMGWLDDICRHMKTNNSKPINYWTFDKCEELAINYKFRSEFKNENRSAYNSAYKNKWLDDICSHMPKRKPKS